MTHFAYYNEIKILSEPEYIPQIMVKRKWKTLGNPCKSYGPACERLIKEQRRRGGHTKGRIMVWALQSTQDYSRSKTP